MNLSTAIKLATNYTLDPSIGTTAIVINGKNRYALVIGSQGIDYQIANHPEKVVAEFESIWQWQSCGNNQWEKVNTVNRQNWIMPELNPSQNLSR
jgi:hypothetical protein